MKQDVLEAKARDAEELQRKIDEHKRKMVNLTKGYFKQVRVCVLLVQYSLTPSGASLAGLGLKGPTVDVLPRA